MLGKGKASSSYPKQKWATSVPGISKTNPSINYKSRYSQPGYGTNFGTSFSKKNQYRQKPGYSKKVLGLGVAAGFVGGATLGAAYTEAKYSVYHRYQAFKNMMHSRGFRSYRTETSVYDTDDGDYFSSYYESNQCLGGCPVNGHCEWGICECNSGFERIFGQCHPKHTELDPDNLGYYDSVPCCFDMNMICEDDGKSGRCKCKPDMRYNKQAHECQIYIDVNCSAFTYETPPSPLILETVSNTIPQENNTILSDNNQTLQNQTSKNDSADKSSTEIKMTQIEESLSNSLLTKLDKDKATENDLTEAFCRDVDSFNFDMNTEDASLKPSNCEKIPEEACGVAYDSSTCSGGWGIVLDEGGISFPYFSSYWKYRNDIDVLGVRAGCFITAFSSTGFTGKSETFKAEFTDQWIVLSEYPKYKHLFEDIESLVCMCMKSL